MHGTATAVAVVQQDGCVPQVCVWIMHVGTASADYDGMAVLQSKSYGCSPSSSVCNCCRGFFWQKTCAYLIPIRIPVGSGLSPGVCASLTKLGFDNTNPALFGCSWVSLGGAKSGIWCQWVPLPSGHLVVPAPQRGLLGVIWHVSRYTQPAIPARAISRLVHAPAVTVATPQLLALCAQCKSVADILRYPNDTNAVVLSNTRD